MPKDQTPCSSCSKPSKYKCPRCLAPSCSMLCVQTHKTTSNCNGIRDKTQYVSLRTFDSSQLASDFAFLEGGARVADNAARDTINTSETQPTHSKLTPKQQHLLRNCSSRKITLRFMPRGMSRHESNQSLFHIKPFLGNVCVSTIQTGIKEAATLKDTLIHLLSPKSSPIPPEKLCQLTRFSGAPVDTLFVYLRREHVPANEPLYHVLKPHATILESLTKKVVVEYPTFLVSLDALEQSQVAADASDVGDHVKSANEVEAPSASAVTQLEVDAAEIKAAEISNERNSLEGLGDVAPNSSFPQSDDSHVEVEDGSGVTLELQ
ncbi:Box C/D snoRNA protein 1 [Chytriomyces hyalinus]|nr:Box C/D snoRNA protein 1 [Chytriomyces hyalinus]